MSQRTQILEILEKYPETRNNDNELIFRYLATYYIENWGERNILKNCIRKCKFNLAGIVRERARIQNTLGLYPPTERVKKARKEKEIKCRENFGIDYKSIKQQSLIKRILNFKIW